MALHMLGESFTIPNPLFNLRKKIMTIIIETDFYCIAGDLVLVM